MSLKDATEAIDMHVRYMEDFLLYINEKNGVIELDLMLLTKIEQILNSAFTAVNISTKEALNSLADASDIEQKTDDFYKINRDMKAYIKSIIGEVNSENIDLNRRYQINSKKIYEFAYKLNYLARRVYGSLSGSIKE